MVNRVKDRKKQREAALVFSYNRELFTLTDKGTIAIDWVKEIPQKSPSKRQKPILLMIVGIGGDNNYSYVLE